MSVFLIGALGLALDGAQMFAQQQMAQTAADAAAQAGILSLFRGTNATAGAPFGTGSPPAPFTCGTMDARTPCVYARLNGFGGTSADTVSVTFPTVVTGVSNLSSATTVNVIAVTAQRRLKTALIRLVGPATVTVQGSATAATVTTALGCLTALSSSANGAITIANNANVLLNNCGITDNSGSLSALVVNNNAQVQAASINVVGGRASATTPRYSRLLRREQRRCRTRWPACRRRPTAPRRVTQTRSLATTRPGPCNPERIAGESASPTTPM